MEYKLKNRIILLSLLVPVFALLGFAQAEALTLTPTRFEIKGNPGEVLRQELKVLNEEKSTQVFYLSYSNFEAQGESGTPAFTDPTSGLGTWISTPFNSVTLSPGEQRSVPFTIRIPADADPGGHFAVIFLGTNPPGGADGVSIGAKTGVLVLLSVAGDVVEDAGLLSFNVAEKKFWHQSLPVSFEYRFRNDGGDRIKPVGEIKIRNTFFIRSDRFDANKVEGNILPKSTRRFEVDWVKYERPADYIPADNFVAKFFSNAEYQWKNFALGLYSAKLDLAYGSQGEHARKLAWFFVFPWQLVVVMLVVLLVVFFGGRKLISRYNRYIIEKARASMRQ